ncbi:hypothetical protein UFOVP1361_24 [uncultured Caudovirales phage]|uniref:Uncharacterized protein n=1 Tax=uncultured Caudovirales phage TaxID=2100421 RepID=A0A6J5S4P7_9CAUD|nr:hypothetical protein UFOVP1361_24 [uncultured Caudovirales phage]
MKKDKKYDLNPNTEFDPEQENHTVMKEEEFLIRSCWVDEDTEMKDGFKNCS